jgi:putative AdoMet-dependent methyltransferase
MFSQIMLSSEWGVDFSSEMLALARAKPPQVRLVQADLLGCWPAELGRFDCIVLAYVLHEFDLTEKISLLRRLADHHLAEHGRIVIGDIAFPTVQARKQAHQRWVDQWDEDEHYWAADEAIAACERAGLDAAYTQVSSCGGAFVIEPSIRKNPRSSAFIRVHPRPIKLIPAGKTVL